jgi:Glutaminase
MKKIFNRNIYVLLLTLLFAVSCNRNTDLAGGTGSGGNNISNRVAATDAPGDAVVTSIAAINQLPDGSMEYLFNEREARYRVARDNPNAEAILRTARDFFGSNKPIKLISSVPGELTELGAPTPAEAAAYLEWMRNNIVNPEKLRVYNANTVDTLVFNTVDWQKWNVFARCTKIIPSYTTAKKIFDFCKQQTCTVGPTQIIPCIPFNYAVDGCFARAHKMRYIIEQRYGYCSEKVFSFGDLWVRASLSGGCCVSWWYHVAPLVRVSQGPLARPLCYVIDPSMFTQPVLLSTWLAAQGNTSCYATAGGVSSYSIQPSTTYGASGTPSSFTYTTETGYTKTDTDLLYFGSQGTTCGN